MTALVGWIGRLVLSFLREIGALVILLIRILAYAHHVFKDRRLIVEQMLQVGVQSLPLVSVVSIFTGAVASWQAVYQFDAFIGGGASREILGSAVSAAILIELAPVLAGIVVAGRVGASIAAELGTMRVTEQIDALETLAIDPVRYLAVPRFTAGWTMLPVLVTYANVVAHMGAFLVAHLLLDISTQTFFGGVQSHFLVYNVFAGLLKAMFFGGGTALIGCYIGFSTKGGAEGVGKATIRAFVFSSAYILIADYVLAMLLF